LWQRKDRLVEADLSYRVIRARFGDRMSCRRKHTLGTKLSPGVNGLASRKAGHLEVSGCTSTLLMSPSLISRLRSTNAASLTVLNFITHTLSEVVSQGIKKLCKAAGNLLLVASLSLNSSRRAQKSFCPLLKWYWCWVLIHN